MAGHARDAGLRAAEARQSVSQTSCRPSISCRSRTPRDGGLKFIENQRYRKNGTHHTVFLLLLRE
eukprot:scaffold30979_cov62-Phaeocystis_antarctica.AAC.1